MVVAYGNQIAMEPSLEAALARIFGGRARVEEAAARPADRPAPGAAAPGPSPERAIPALIQQAMDAWQKSQDALRRGDWAAYGSEQKRLEETLRQLQANR